MNDSGIPPPPSDKAQRLIVPRAWLDVVAQCAVAHLTRHNRGDRQRQASDLLYRLGLLLARAPFGPQHRRELVDAAGYLLAEIERLDGAADGEVAH